MNSYYLFAAINLTCSLLPVLAGSFRFREHDNGTKIFFALVSLGFVTECVAICAAIRYRNNYPVYNISNLFQVLLICMYFNFCITKLKAYNTGFYIGLISVLIGIANMIWLQPIDTNNSNYSLYQTLLVAGLSIAFLTDYALSSVFVSTKYIPHMFFSLVLMFFVTFNYLNFSLYDYFSSRLKEKHHYIDIAITSVNAITNICFAIIFLRYPKLIKRYAR